MDWSLWLIGLGVVIALWVLKVRTQISPDLARKLARAGAVVLDVRSASEYASGHLPQAINVPLDELVRVAPSRFPDPNTVVLLHCLSGGRSAIGVRRLRGLGYRQAFNLGSFTRARALLVPRGTS